MLKYILLLLAVAVVFWGLVFSGIAAGPGQAPIVITVLIVAFVGLALCVRKFVYKKMR